MKELGEKPPVTYSKYDHNPNCTLSVLEKGTSIFLQSDFSTLYNYRTSREYNTLRNGDHCSPDIRACKTWNAKKKGNQHRNSGEKEKENFHKKANNNYNASISQNQRTEKGEMGDDITAANKPLYRILYNNVFYRITVLFLHWASLCL